MTTEQVSKEEVSFQLISCISSGQEFSLNSPIIFESLSQQSKPYVNAFLSCLKDIFVSDEYAPMLKFYSLFLLVKASEQNNPLLMTQIGRNKDLLNYIFKAVQYDHKKPVEERGHAFFSKNPSQETSTIGHNFVVLLLEAFQYWSQAYQSTDTENPLHIYMSMFKSLSSKIEFPAQAKYVGQNHEMTEDFHLKPVESLGGQSGGRSINAQKSPTQAASTSSSKKSKASNFSKPKVNMQDLVVSHIEACCTTTGENYSKNIGTILQHLNSKEYIDELLLVVGSLLESPTTKPLVKLYTMWVLIKATETKNKVLVSELARSETVLNQVLQAAQFDYDRSFDEKGLQFFTESDVGNKYVNASLEAVKYWATEYGSSDPNNPFYSFTFMYDSLKASMIFPNRYTFVGTSPQTDIMTLGGIDLQKLAADFGQKDSFQPAVSSSSQDPLIANVETGFQRLKEGKLMVREALETNQEEDPNMREFFDYLIEDLVRITDQELQPHIEPLIGYNNPAAEKYVTQGFAEVENVQKIKSEYNKYKNKKQGYSQFRETSLYLLQESDAVGVQPSRPQNTGKSQFNESPARPLSRASAQEEIPPEDDFFGTGGAINVNKTKNVRGGFQTESPSKYSAQKPSAFQPQPQEEEAGFFGTGGQAKTVNKPTTVKGGFPEEDDFFGTGGQAKTVSKSKNVKGGFSSVQPEEDDFFGTGGQAKTVNRPSNVKGGFSSVQPEEDDFFGAGGQAKTVSKSKNVKGGFSGGPSSSQKPMSNSPSKIQVQESSFSPSKPREEEYKSQINPIPTNIRQEPVQEIRPVYQQQPQKVKKPAIIGEDSKPLSNKDFYPPQQNEWEDDYYNRQSSSQFGNERYGAYPNYQEKQAGNRRFASAQDEASETQYNNRPYLEDTRYKWLSNYRFKAGLLQDDKEDPEIELYYLRTGELCDDTAEDSPLKEASHLKADQDKEQELIGLPKEILHQEAEKKAVLPPQQDKTLKTEESMKESMFTSLKSPSNRKDLSSELGNIERGIKSSSKVKAAELAKIETSIRSSFKQSGKHVPNFQNLQDLEVKEEVEKELTKLRTENGRLQRENKFLKDEADKNRVKLENSFDQVEVEKLIKNYDHQVTHLREELSVVKDENTRLNQDLSVFHEERKSQNPTANALYDENQSLKQQLEKLKKEMSSLKGYSPTHETSNILPSGMSKNASAKTFTSGGGQPDLLQSKQGSKRAIFEKVNYEKPQLLMTGEDVVLQNSFKNLQPTSTLNKEQQRYNHPDYEYTSPSKKPAEEKPFRSPSPSHDHDHRYDSGLGVSLHQHESPQPNRHRVEGSPQDAISKEEEFTRMLANYHLLQSKEKVKAGEDSEFDIKGMISSRKDEGQKEIRGIQIKGDALVLSNMARNVQYLHSPQELMRFRLACLKNKATLFENDIIQVGVISNVIREKTEEVNLLKLGLYFGSKTNQAISNFKASIANTKSFSGYVKSNRLEGTLEQGKQLKQQHAISFKSTPFECLQLNISFELDYTPVQFDVSLPNVITKFMEFKYVSTEEFRERWKLRNHMVLKSEEIEIDPYIIRSTYDFKKYFGYLVDLKPMDEYDFVQGKKGIKLGGLFELETTSVDYLLKINILPSHKVVFQVACSEDKWDVASFLVQTLTFLFQKRN